MMALKEKCVSPTLCEKDRVEGPQRHQTHKYMAFFILYINRTITLHFSFNCNFLKKNKKPIVYAFGFFKNT